MQDVEAVLELFQEEVRELGGRVSDVLKDGDRLFARSILAAEARISGNDLVKPGVALRCMNDTIEVRPYVFRVVCENGAIIAHSGHGESVRYGTPFDVRQAIRNAASPVTFHEFVTAMRKAKHDRPDPALFLMALTRRAGFDAETLLDVLERFDKDSDYSLFGIANAVTALARDTRDPVERWNREAAGAAIFARVLRPVPVRGAGASVPEIV